MADAICGALEELDNAHAVLGEVHVGLRPAGRSKQLRWDDGSPFDASVLPLLHESISEGAKVSVVLRCSPRRELVDAPSGRQRPFACVSPARERKADTKAAEILLDTTKREALARPSWWGEDSATMPDTASATLVALCHWRFVDHHKFALKQLPVQLPIWGDPGDRYFAVWQSKATFGYARYWTKYLERELGFKVIPRVPGSFKGEGLSSGYFHSPADLRHAPPRAVFSRLVVPASLLALIGEGVLINQIYTDPDPLTQPLGQKIAFVRAMRHFGELLGQRRGCSLGSAATWPVPLTFDFSQREGCTAFMARAAALSSAVWVVKGPEHGGKAVRIMTTERVVQRYTMAITHAVDDEDEEGVVVGDEDDARAKRPAAAGAACSAAVLARRETVQSYVERPLLLDGRKFDLRFFMLIPSTRPLLAYLYNESYARASVKLYNDPASSRNAGRHVTNTKVQSQLFDTESRDDWERHIMHPARIKRYARERGVREDFVDGVVLPEVRRALTIVMSATANSLRYRRSGQWQLFGVDVVVDEDLVPWVVDVNSFPGWGWSFRTPWALKYRKRLLRDMWELVLDVQGGNSAATAGRTAPRTGGFQLIFNDGAKA